LLPIVNRQGVHDPANIYGDIALFRAYQAAASRAGLNIEKLPRVGGLSDANSIGSTGLPVIDALGPSGNGAHTDSEYVLASSIVKKTETLVYFLLDQPEIKGRL